MRGGKEGAGSNIGGQGGTGREEDKAEDEAESEVQELLRVADRFQAEGLYKHCLAEFGRALTVETAIPQLVWAHARGPEGAREVAMEYVSANCRAIQVGKCYVRWPGVRTSKNFMRPFMRPHMCPYMCPYIFVQQQSTMHICILVCVRTCVLEQELQL